MDAVGHCSVERCLNEATQYAFVNVAVGGRVALTRTGKLLDRVRIEVPLCTSHRDYLVRDAIHGVSLTAP